MEQRKHTADKGGDKNLGGVEGGEIHPGQQPERQKQQKHRYHAEIHVIMPVVKRVIPMHRHPQRLARCRVVWVFHLQKLRVDVLIINVQMPVQHRFRHSLVLVAVVGNSAVPIGAEPHRQNTHQRGGANHRYQQQPPLSGERLHRRGMQPRLRTQQIQRCDHDAPYQASAQKIFQQSSLLVPYPRARRRCANRLSAPGSIYLTEYHKFPWLAIPCAAFLPTKKAGYIAKAIHSARMDCGSVCFRKMGLRLGKRVLADPAQRTFKIRRHLAPRSARGDAPFGIAFFLIVFPTANFANVHHAASSFFSENHHEQHFEPLLPINRVRVSGGHHNAFACLQRIRFAVDGDAPDSVQTGDHRIAAGSVGADLLVFVKRKQRHADRFVLCHRFADHLTALVLHLLFQLQHRRFVNVFHAVHGNSSLSIVQNFSVYRNGHNLPGNTFSAVLQRGFRRHFQPAAARHLHAHNGDAVDVVAGDDAGQLIGVIALVQLGTADQRDLAAHKLLVQRRIGIRGAIRRDQQPRSVKIRCVFRHQLDLARPLPQLGRPRVRRGGGGVVRLGGVDGAHPRTGTAAVRMWRGRLLPLLVGEHRRLVIRGGFAGGKGDGTGGTRRQAVAQPVAVIVAQQAGFAVHHADRALVTRRRASAAAVAFFFVDLNDLANHIRNLRKVYFLTFRVHYTIINKKIPLF